MRHSRTYPFKSKLSVPPRRPVLSPPQSVREYIVGNPLPIGSGKCITTSSDLPQLRQSAPLTSSANRRNTTLDSCWRLSTCAMLLRSFLSLFIQISVEGGRKEMGRAQKTKSCCCICKKFAMLSPLSVEQRRIKCLLKPTASCKYPPNPSEYAVYGRANLALSKYKNMRSRNFLISIAVNFGYDPILTYTLTCTLPTLC